VHAFAHNRETLTQGHPEDRIAHPRWGKGSVKDIQNRSSLTERVRALNPGKFLWEASHPTERVPSHRPAAPENCLSPCVSSEGSLL